MKTFVTGGSGFLGGALISDLLRHGDTVVALSRSDAADARIRKAAPSSASLTIVRGGLSDKQSMEQGMRGCDVVFHSAAKVEVWGPWSSFYEANVTGTQNVVDGARAAGVARLVHVSTEAVLVRDSAPIVNADETWPIKEPPFYAPYSHSKALAEEVVKTANSPATGFTTVIVRPRFVWGKGDTTLLPAVALAVQTGAWKFFSPAPYKISTVNIANVCEGMRLAAEKGRGGEAYFLTDGEPIEFETLIGRLLATRGLEYKGGWRLPYSLAWRVCSLLESIPMLGYGTTRRAPLSRQMLALFAHEVTVNDGKARRELGYTSSVSVDQGLQELREEQLAAARQ